MKKEILDYIRKERSKYNNDVDDAEDFLSRLVDNVIEKFEVPCAFLCAETFDGGPGYEATSYVIVAFYNGRFLYDTLLSEVY